MKRGKAQNQHWLNGSYDDEHFTCVSTFIHSSRLVSDTCYSDLFFFRGENWYSEKLTWLIQDPRAEPWLNHWLPWLQRPGRFQYTTLSQIGNRKWESFEYESFPITKIWKGFQGGSWKEQKTFIVLLPHGTPTYTLYIWRSRLYIKDQCHSRQWEIRNHGLQQEPTQHYWGMTTGSSSVKPKSLCAIAFLWFGPWWMLGWPSKQVEVSRSCLTLCDPMDCSLLGSSSMEFSRQEYWSGLPFPSPGYLSNPGIEPRSPA